MRNRMTFLATLSLGVATFSLIASAQAPAEPGGTESACELEARGPCGRLGP